ncbi:1-phosphofructokinase family hexose kinase [Amycolatopsis acidiphila]|uniref:1-phosphofructokinase family hexose kinase n=1 Tax=Amycolatopsis acidiphila TaxID=715473 RepID=A0A558ACC0_9PSEU|nr:1-phosphofructokinase family hexose kinase [Amycolatopsis acidiphila]TVT21921.1 1-phosphofructokinase family hexose kinase [Amycolatopsis acidiphila]UIJ57343.1 1-phosphofructokinase family hexose kinase [Amycolatopsis acidiphila]GHG84697.1 1-phosphofructokinase [Amycolatopsis acidiphila]
MIVTVTPNPSVDRTIFVDGLVRGSVIRAKRSLSEPSGKGVNVSLALQAHRHPTTAVLPLGGTMGAQLSEMLTATGMTFRPVPIQGSTRSNVSLTEPDGTVTKINEHGPALTPDEARALRDAALAASREAHCLAVCGSLPEGLDDAFYPELLGAARELGLRVAVDTSGVALQWAVKAGPDVIKPNREELAEATGSMPATVGEVVAAARLLRERGARTVLASLGPDGAVLVEDDLVVHGEAPVERPVSTVGAGDALLAGFLAAGGTGPEALAAGLLWAAASVQHPGTLFTATKADATVILHETLDPARRLTH